jgi:hypothetical protein
LDELVNEQPLLLDVKEHLLVVMKPDPELVIGTELPLRVNVLFVALKVPVFEIEQGLPDMVNVAPESVTVPEFDKEEL